jgi:hypothetical protein
MRFAWPLNETAISYFISWSSFVKKHSPNTTTTYLSMLKLIHFTSFAGIGPFISVFSKYETV